MKTKIALLATALAALATPALAGYNKPSMGENVIYKAKYEDTFVHLARDYNLGYVELRAANPNIDPWLPGAGTELVLPLMQILPDAPHEGIVINMPEMRLFAFVNGDNAPDTYPIGVGREGLQTPLGSTKVARKMENPIWRPTPRMLKEHPELKPEVGPGPDNPQGNRILYLAWPQYGIHGTNKPFGIGRRSSSGCIRMYPESILDLYEKIPVGTKVTVVNQPIKLAWVGDKLYLEAHPDIDQATQMEEYGYVQSEKLRDEDMKQILKVAGKDQDKLHWAAIRKAIKERNGYPIVIARRLPTGDVVADNDADKFRIIDTPGENHAAAMTLKPNEQDTIETSSGEVIEVEDKTKDVRGQSTAEGGNLKTEVSTASNEPAATPAKAPVRGKVPVNPKTLNQ